MKLEAKCHGLGTRTFRDSAIESQQRKQKQVSYPEGDVQSTAVEVHPLLWLPLRQRFMV